MVTGAGPKPDTDGVGNLATGAEPRVPAELLHRRLRHRVRHRRVYAQRVLPDECDAHPPQLHKIVDGADN